MSVLPSYRNQSIDLHSKSIDWFLYGGSTAFNGLSGIRRLRKTILSILPDLEFYFYPNASNYCTKNEVFL